MQPGISTYGTWSGGRFMHFGEPLEEARFENAIRTAYESGIRTFMSADVYGIGQADSALGRALKDFPRESYCLIGMIGHDIYEGKRAGAKGYARFTDPELRSPKEYLSYLRMASEKSLERVQSDHFDLLLLHNPDRRGYSQDTVWEALRTIRDEGLTTQLGVAPGPANGFTLDLIQCFERFGEAIDWSMIILSPLEPWPGRLVLNAAKQHQVNLITRVIDHGGVFMGDVKPGHAFRTGDHRTWRPEGWVEHAWERMAPMDELRQKYGLSWLHFSAVWNLSLEPVKSVAPTLIQETGDDAREFEDKIRELASIPEIRFTPEEVELISQYGDNTGCMVLKGATPRDLEMETADQWELNSDLLEVAKRWEIDCQW